MDYDLTYLSLGAGVQSTALLICSALSLYDVPRADVAIFADTGDEPEAVYRHLWNLQLWNLTYNPIPLLIVREGHLSGDILHKTTGRRAALPFFVLNPDGTDGMAMRQCTDAYKIVPIKRQVRQLLGIKKGERAGKRRARALLGISLDECDRMKDSVVPWIDNSYPLVDARLRRVDCEKIIFATLGYIPTKSACVFCPFHSDFEWRRLQKDAPADFAKAVNFDRSLRGPMAATRSMRGKLFLHRSMLPLDEIDFGQNQLDLFANECSGVCGV